MKVVELPTSRRFDIRFASLDQLQKGEDFAIIEMNGAGAEASVLAKTLWPYAHASRSVFGRSLVIHFIRYLPNAAKTISYPGMLEG